MLMYVQPKIFSCAMYERSLRFLVPIEPSFDLVGQGELDMLKVSLHSQDFLKYEKESCSTTYFCGIC